MAVEGQHRGRRIEQEDEVAAGLAGGVQVRPRQSQHQNGQDEQLQNEENVAT